MLAELGGKLRDSLNKLSSSSGNIDNTEINIVLTEISRSLIEADVNVKIVMTIRDNIKNRMKDMSNTNQEISRVMQRAVIDELVSMLTPKTNKKSYVMKRNRSNIILFVGLQGAGKTTSIAKFANHYQRKGWKTAMVCADTFRAGAFDQLKQNATKLRVPFYGSYTEADPITVAEDGVSQFIKDGYEVIIVDTSGRHRQESALFEEMQEISAVIHPHNTVLVMDATQGQAVYDQALAFHHAVSVGSVIVTKIDGHAKGGGALSAVTATQSPIIFVGNGEHFDDFDSFHAHSFVSKLLGRSDMRGLMETMKQVQGSGKQQTELYEKFSKGQFTLRDMYNQFQNILKLGPMNKVMGQFMPDYLIPNQSEADGSLRIKKFLYMMDSMTDQELDGKVNFSDTKLPLIEKRITRIARGSGVHPTEVKILLQCHKHFEGIVAKVGKSGLMKGMKGAPGPGAAGLNNPRVAEQLKRNPNLMQQIQKMQQMMGGKGTGGPPNMAAFESMMKQMGGNPGAAGLDFNAMAQMMQSMGGMPGMPPSGSRR